MKSNKKMLTLLMSAVMCMSTLSFTSCGSKKLQHVDAVDATCTTDGHSEYYTDGSKYFSDENGKTEVDYADLIIAAKGHTEKTDWATSDTQHWHDCSVCGKPATDQESHVFGDWVYDVPPTASAPGEGHKECETCDYKTVKETVPPTGGGGTEVTLTRVPPRDSTCKIPGNIEYWTDGTKCYSDKDGKNEISRESTLKQLLPHTPESEWHKTDPDLHWHDCSVCGDPADEKQPHSLGDWVYDRQPTASEEGLRHKVCSDCGYETTPETAPVLGTVTHHPAKSPTCVSPGNIEYWEKDGKNYSNAECTEEITGDVDIDPTGVHTPASAWSTDGAQHWHNCTVCGDPADTKVNHTDGDWVTTDADKHWRVCSVCNGKITATEAAHTHKWEKNTTEHPNAHREYCDCGKEFTAWEAHTFGSWTTTKEPTTSEKGSKERTCTSCSHKEIEEIPMIVENITHHAAVAPTCTEAGTVEYWEKDGKKYSDAACNNEITDITGDAALGHDWASAFIPDTSDANGGKFFKVCNRDNSHKEGLVENAYYDRHIKIGDTIFTAYDCFTSNKDKGVTFDVIKEAFVIDPAKFADGIAYSGNDSNNKIIIKTDVDATVASVSIMGGYGHCAAEFIGNGKLTVMGQFVTESHIAVNSDITVNGGYKQTYNELTINSGTMTVVDKMEVNGLIVGAVDGTSDPVLNVKSTENGIIRGGDGASVQINRGTVNVQHEGSNAASAIDLGGKDKTFTVGANARLKVNGFVNGLYNSSLAVNGTAYFVNCQSSFNSAKADVNAGLLIVDSDLTDGFGNGFVGSELNISGGVVKVSAYRGLNNTATTVTGGQLDVLAGTWAFDGGSATFTGGKATVMRSGGTDYAAFSSMSNLTVSEGFDLGIKNLSQLLVNMTDASTVNVAANVTVVAENISNFEQGLPDGIAINHVNGTVTPAEIATPDIPDIA